MEHTEHLEDKPMSSLTGRKRKCTDHNTQVRQERPASVLGAQASCSFDLEKKKMTPGTSMWGIWKTEFVGEKRKQSL